MSVLRQQCEVEVNNENAKFCVIKNNTALRQETTKIRYSTLNVLRPLSDMFDLGLHISVAVIQQVSFSFFFSSDL